MTDRRPLKSRSDQSDRSDPFGILDLFRSDPPANQSDQSDRRCQRSDRSDPPDVVSDQNSAAKTMWSDRTDRSDPQAHEGSPLTSQNAIGAEGRPVLVLNAREVGRDVPGAVYCGRPGPWGNPFRIGPDGTRAEVVAKYRDWLMARTYLVAKAKAELRGRDLVCWCAPEACHADVLAEVANAPDAADIANPPAPDAAPAPAPETASEAPTSPYGTTIGGRLLTSTGRPVSPEEWATLSEWDKHGPNGRLWCGCCQAWVPRETALAHAEAGRAEWLSGLGVEREGET